MALSFLGFYCFNNNSTSSVLDWSVQGRNSSSVTGLTISTDSGAVGKVGVFDGLSTVINLGDISAYDSLTAFSIVCKFKADVIGGRMVLSSRVSHHIFEITAAGYLKITLDGAGSTSVTSATLLTAGTWYTAIMTWNGSNAYIYINNEDTVTSGAIADTLNNNANSIYIGWYTPDYYFDGMLEMISYYNRAFDSSEIQSAMEFASGLKYEIADAKIQTGDLIVTNSGGREICTWSEEFDERLFSDEEDHQFSDETAMMF